MKLSDTALIILNRAAQRDDGLVFHRKESAPGPELKCAWSLENKKLLDLIDAPFGTDGLITTEVDEVSKAFRITPLGLTTIGVEPEQPAEVAPPAPAAAAKKSRAKKDAPTVADTAPPAASDSGVAQEDAAVADALDAATVAPTARATLRSAAAAALAAFDKRGDDVIASFEMCEAMLALRTALAEKPARAPGGEKTPRAMTGAQSILVALCQREQGATAKELADGAGWPSIAARSVMTKIAERFGFTMSEKPKAAGRGVTFYLSTPQA